MPDATVKRLDEMESFYDGLVTRARAELGVTSWGMQVFNFPPADLRSPRSRAARTRRSSRCLALPAELPM